MCAIPNTPAESMLRQVSMLVLEGGVAGDGGTEKGGRKMLILRRGSEDRGTEKGGRKIEVLRRGVARCGY
eukprot:1288062-Rhodomonas_salina.1